MFNTTIQGTTRTQYVPYEKSVNVIENRAPTDKSVELLNDMQKQALKNLLASVRIEDNDLRGSIILMSYNPMNCSHEYIAKFTLNGNNHEISGEIRENRSNMVDSAIAEIIKNLYKELSESIAQKLITGSQLFNKLRAV